MVRSYHGENASSRPIREAKLRWADSSSPLRDLGRILGAVLFCFVPYPVPATVAT